MRFRKEIVKRLNIPDKIGHVGDPLTNRLP
jgi:hypothetical protein